jgi:hypothetical protein
MGLDISKMLTPSKSPFYGNVPGNAAAPLGSLTLLVTFMIKENYRIEYIKFEVANFELSYHAILGGPALAKFIAVPHDIYLLLKLQLQPTCQSIGSCSSIVLSNSKFENMNFLGILGEVSQISWI